MTLVERKELERAIKKRIGNRRGGDRRSEKFQSGHLPGLNGKESDRETRDIAANSLLTKSLLGDHPAT
jgi:hypothetical protein